MRVTARRLADRIDSASHQRAIDAVDDDRALIEQGELDRYYRVLLPDSSQGAHDTMLAIDRWGHLQADCHCAHMTHGDGPCAHILTLLLAVERDMTTVDGQPIEPADRWGHDDTDTEIDASVDPDPVTVDADPVDTGEGITVDGGIDTDDNWSDRL